MDHFIALQVFIIVLAIINFGRVDAGGSAGYMCAQIGARQLGGTAGFTWTGALGMFSIGADNFKIKMAGAFDGGIQTVHSLDGTYKPETYARNECPYNFVDGYAGAAEPTTDVEPCPNNLEVRIYTVQQKDRTLQGWLHVEIELTDNSDEIEAIYVQMRDEYHNAVGEIMPEGIESCPSTKLPQPTKFQILPCTAIGQREPKPCSALFMVKKSQLQMTSKAFQDSAKYLGDQDPGRGISFTWRFSEYWCNRHKMIRADAMILTTQNIKRYNDNPNPTFVAHGPHKLLRKASNYWVKADWFGSYDIRLPKDGTFKCDELVMDGTMTQDKMTPSSKSAKIWIKEIIKSKFSQDYMHPKELYYPDPSVRTFSGKSCQVDPHVYTYSKQYVPGLKFSGRCGHLWHKIPPPKRGQVQSCNTDPNAPEFEGLNVTFEKYKAYRSTLFDTRKKMCTKECYLPKTSDDLKILLNFTRSNFTKIFTNSTSSGNFTRPNTSIARFYFGRKFHGMMCLLAALFFTPISLFSARYLKETFMQFRCGGGNPWFWVHVGTSVGSICVYATSITALLANVESWGRNEDFPGVAHDGLGYLSLVVFVSLLISGGLRCGREKGQKCMRVICLSLHSVTGFIHYLMNFILIGISTQIPGSPSLADCIPNGIDKGMPTGFPPIVGVLAAWIGIDIAFHVVLTVLQVLADRKRKLRRGWYCPILPILQGDFGQDMQGSGLRKLLFLIYCVLCVAFSFGSIGILASKDISKMNCTNGKMSCNTQENPFGCTQLAKHYHNAIKNKNPN